MYQENTSLVLFGDVMVRNEIFWTIGEQSCFFCPIISYQRIKVYRVETMYTGRSHWNDGIIGTFLISISTTVITVRDKIIF